MGGTGNGQSDAVAPAPETPQPQVLRAQIQAARQPVAPVPPPAQPAALAAAPAPPVAAPVPDLRSAAASQAVTKAVVHPPPAAAPGGTEVQLAAVETEHAASVEWDRLAKRMPDLIGRHHPAITKAERDGKTFYRLRTGGFTDTAQATAFCVQVKAKGGGCAIAGF